MKTKATMQSNQTGRNALGRSLLGALIGTLQLALNTMKNISGNWSLAGSANDAAASLYLAAISSVSQYWGKTNKGERGMSKRISDWTHSIRGDHSPCRYG